MNMLLRLVAVICLVFIAGSGSALAKSVPVQLQEKQTSEPISPPDNTNTGNASNASLDELFAKLRRETKTGVARATANKIWGEWTQSGSASINLLMFRAIRAMKDNNTALAEDMLDQVVVLAPQFAEGWNRRATLYYTMSDFRRSIADIEVTLALEPRHFGALSGLAAILQQLDHEEEALETWYRVLELYPANKPAQNAVIKLEEKLAGKRS